jgi:ribosomal protein S18 acetylase RimI-like enzyme
VIRLYRESDRPRTEALFDEFQDFLVGLDPLRRLHRRRGYGAAIAAETLRAVANGGRWLVAEANGAVVGFVVGTLHHTTADDEWEVVPTPRGRVDELYVQPQHRRRGIGRNLMANVEKWLREQGCEIVRVEVFAPNESARDFYEALGYAPRDIDHLKVL